MKKVIVFDLDGVLFNTLEAVRSMIFNRYPGITDEDMLTVNSGNYYEEMEKVKKKFPKPDETPEEKEAYFDAYTKRKVESPIYDGMGELVDLLHKSGVILALNTSARERGSIPLLETAGILSCFDFIGTGETSKSKVEKFNMILEKYKVLPSDCLFITDTLGDVREAEKAGVPTIAVTWGAQNKVYLESNAPKNLVAVVDTMEELRKEIGI